MEDRKFLLEHMRRLIALILAWEEYGEKNPMLSNTALIEAAEQLLIETVDRVFRRVPSFPMPEVI